MTRLLVLLALLLSAPAAADAPAANGATDAGVREAFLAAFPVYQIARTRANAIATTRARGRDVVNAFGHRARLATPADRAVTTPNNDTLISSAWLDLSRGPVLLQLPSLPDRYHSVALMDVFTDHFAIVGSRDGGMGGRFLITPPGWRGEPPPGARRIEAPGMIAWALGRVLVTGPADLPAAAAAQSGLLLIPAAPDTTPTPTPTPLPAIPDARGLLAATNALLAEAGVPASHRARLAPLARYGLRPGPDGWDALPPAVRASWKRQLPALLAEVRAGFLARGATVNGWNIPPANIGNFGNDDFYRAAVALGGLAALPPSEAIYLSHAAPAGTCAEIAIPADVPIRAEGFWSLTLYEVVPDGRKFLHANAIDRFAIGDRTPGLIRRADGTLVIRVAPTGEGGNWLPAPTGPWELAFRLYLPDARASSGEWRLAAPRPVDCEG